jgi:hypothetical protein
VKLIHAGSSLPVLFIRRRKIMAKPKDKKKRGDKKKPLRTLKEKRKDKRDKKNNKNNPGLLDG